MDIIKISDKSIAKLIDVVSKGIGTLYKPRVMRKEADAEAYKIEVLANAEAKKILIEGDAKIELIQRTKERLYYQELNRQKNIEEIAEKSIKFLDKNVSDEPVDEDWRTRFFSKAQDITGEEMQEIWAKILAGEVSQPRSISLRTLEVVANISKEEAKIFQRACNLASGRGWIWKVGKTESLNDFGINYGDLLELREAGLIHNGDNLVRIIYVISLIPTEIHIGDEIYTIHYLKNPDLKQYRIDQYAFTDAGSELCRLFDAKLSMRYFYDLMNFFKSEGYQLNKIESIHLDDNKQL